jgi:hypothetical protein
MQRILPAFGIAQASSSSTGCRVRVARRVTQLSRRPLTSIPHLRAQSPAPAPKRPAFRNPPNAPNHSLPSALLTLRNTNALFLRYLTYTLLGFGATFIIYWSGTHLYVELIYLGYPSGPSSPNRTDPYGWQEEAFPWTGGEKGGTSPEIGWRGRMALRAAWMAINWGMGQGKSLPYHHDPPLPDWFVRYVPVSGVGKMEDDNRYEVAEGYIDEAILEARKRGIKFPPTLSPEREFGPPKQWGSGVGGAEDDAVGRDLLIIKASILERIGTVLATKQARELYEQVLLAGTPNNSPAQEATAMRLAHKIGEMCVRVEETEEGLDWWAWGLKRVALRIPKQPLPVTTSTWFGLGKPIITQSDPVPQSTAIIPRMSPPVHRAAITILTSLSTHFATSNQLPLASAVQLTALSILPGTHILPAPIPGDAPEILHDTWLQHRSATISFHHSEVLNARQDSRALSVCSTSLDRALNVMSALEPMPTAYAIEGVPWHGAATSLREEALALAAETSYTKGLLLERSEVYDMSEVLSLYERAMSISAGENTGGAAEKNADWRRYNKRFSKIKGLIEQSRAMNESPVDVELRGV